MLPLYTKNFFKSKQWFWTEMDAEFKVPNGNYTRYTFDWKNGNRGKYDPRGEKPDEGLFKGKFGTHFSHAVDIDVNFKIATCQHPQTKHDIADLQAKKLDSQRLAKEVNDTMDDILRARSGDVVWGVVCAEDSKKWDWVDSFEEKKGLIIPDADLDPGEEPRTVGQFLSGFHKLARVLSTDPRFKSQGEATEILCDFVRLTETKDQQLLKLLPVAPPHVHHIMNTGPAATLLTGEGVNMSAKTMKIRCSPDDAKPFSSPLSMDSVSPPPSKIQGRKEVQEASKPSCGICQNNCVIC